MIDVFLAATLLTQAPTPTPPPTPPALSALHQAQIEVYLLRLRVLQLEVQVQQQALAEQRARLDAAIAAAHPGFRLDWATGQLVPQEAAQ